MKFCGIQKTSLIDFPDRVSTVLFTPDCNLRCPFCHNWRIVLNPKPPFLNEAFITGVLERRKKYIDAVVITGGEPTLHQEIPRFLRKLKERDFLIKLDTNGFFPKILKECLPFLDYVALDVKTSLEKYHLLGGQSTDSFLQTVEILRDGEVDYEFRATAVPRFVEEGDIPKMGEVVKGAKRFALQQFVCRDTLDKTFSGVRPYSIDVIASFAEVMKQYVDEVVLRM